MGSWDGLYKLLNKLHILLLNLIILNRLLDYVYKFKEYNYTDVTFV
jgi:hypothetical protein